MTVSELKTACQGAKDGHIHLATESSVPPFPATPSWPPVIERKESDGVIYWIYDANKLFAAIENHESALNAFAKVPRAIL